MIAPSALELPDLLGTAPADLIDQAAEQPAADVATARQRAERIRADLAGYTRMRQDIADAYACRDWLALGYDTWFAYLEGEFGPELQQLARDRGERRQAVADLRGQGLSTRQIGAVTGVDPKTVRNDLAEVGTSPQPERVTGSDGKTYPAKKPAPETAKPDTVRIRAHAWQIMHPDAHVWIATSRIGIEYHQPAVPGAPVGGPSPFLTVCGRSMRTGERISVADVENELSATPCVRCWPDPAEADTEAAFPIGRRVEWDDGGTGRTGVVRHIYPGGRALWVIDDRGLGHTVGPRAARLLDAVEPAAAAGTTNSPAGPAASAPDPRAETVSGDSRPQDRPGTLQPEPAAVTLRRELSRRAHDSLADRDEPLVWIAVGREGVTYHLPVEDNLTACGRSMRTGEKIAIGIVEWRHAATACDTCWPAPAAAGELETGTCERCGATIPRDEAIAGYTRCERCDPDGDHTEHVHLETVELPPVAVETGTGAEVYDYGTIAVGNREIRVRAGRLAGDDVPVVWLAVEDAGVQAELLALSPLKVEVLIKRLEAAHRWTIAELRS